MVRLFFYLTSSSIFPYISGLTVCSSLHCFIIYSLAALPTSLYCKYPTSHLTQITRSPSVPIDQNTDDTKESPYLLQQSLSLTYPAHGLAPYLLCTTQAAILPPPTQPRPRKASSRQHQREIMEAPGAIELRDSPRNKCYRCPWAHSAASGMHLHRALKCTSGSSLPTQQAMSTFCTRRVTGLHCIGHSMWAISPLRTPAFLHVRPEVSCLSY